MSETNPVGRPKEYTEEWVEEQIPLIPEMFVNGESLAEVCATLGMCKETFYTLTKKYPQFLDAYKRGKQLSEAWWTKLGREGASGVEEIQPTTWIFNMKNRFGWVDKVESINTNIETTHEEWLKNLEN